MPVHRFWPLRRSTQREPCAPPPSYHARLASHASRAWRRGPQRKLSRSWTAAADARRPQEQQTARWQAKLGVLRCERARGRGHPARPGRTHHTDRRGFSRGCASPRSDGEHDAEKHRRGQEEAAAPQQGTAPESRRQTWRAWTAERRHIRGQTTQASHRRSPSTGRVIAESG